MGHSHPRPCFVNENQRMPESENIPPHHGARPPSAVTVPTGEPSGLSALPTLHFPLERSQALMRGVTRILCAAILTGAAYIIRPDWGLLWNTQKASFMAFAVVLLVIGIAALALGIAGARWLLTSIWLGPLEIKIGPEGIHMRLGPGGVHHHAWSDLRLELDETVDWEFLDMMPDDAFVPRLHQRSTGKDIGAMILSYARISHEAFTQCLRPYLKVVGNVPE